MIARLIEVLLLGALLSFVPYLVGCLVGKPAGSSIFNVWIVGLGCALIALLVIAVIVKAIIYIANG